MDNDRDGHRKRFASNHHNHVMVIYFRIPIFGLEKVSVPIQGHKMISILAVEKSIGTFFTLSIGTGDTSPKYVLDTDTAPKNTFQYRNLFCTQSIGI
jgi:hypothetical protein